MLNRRAWLLIALLGGGARADGVRRGRTLVFPRDHGAHLETRIEWWYATGWLGTVEQPRAGFQVTFFRSRTGLAESSPSRFAARQLLFAHAAVTDLAAARHVHSQRVSRWSGAADDVLAAARVDGGDVHIGRWRLRDRGDGYEVTLRDDALALDLHLQRTQPLLLQGDAGWSRKGPQPEQASHYVSEPQLAVTGHVERAGQRIDAPGRAWLDHEWSDQLLDASAVGWDWVGFNLTDGSALTAFRLRRADGGATWAGGSWRAPGQTVQDFDAGAVVFEPGRRWTSPSSAATYPVEWTLQTPAGRFRVRALLDAQELDSRTSTGAIYWEGLSELLDAEGRRIGLGYLEMTGYAGRLRL